MYTPPAFKVDDLERLHAILRQHSFATLVTTGKDGPVVSHLPLLLNPDFGSRGQLVGHMAKANGQWREAEGQTVLAIFHGPQTYVSPSWYPDSNAVPTWNYVAVHARGVFRKETNPDRLLRIVSDYVTEYESSMPKPWALDSQDDEFIRQLTGAIVGFTIDIDHLEGKWKLNQNQSAERQQGVVEGLRERGRGHDHAIADLMESISGST